MVGAGLPRQRVHPHRGVMTGHVRPPAIPRVAGGCGAHDPFRCPGYRVAAHPVPDVNHSARGAVRGGCRESRERCVGTGCSARWNGFSETVPCRHASTAAVHGAGHGLLGGNWGCDGHVIGRGCEVGGRGRQRARGTESHVYVGHPRLGHHAVC